MTEHTHNRLRALSDPDHLPALSPEYLRAQPALGLGPLDPAPRILLLYGSLRERSYSRLDAAKTRMEWEAHNQVFRRDRADVARSATMSKAAAYSQPGGALNFREQMDGLAKRIAVDLREIMARAFAIQTGMKSVYGIGVDWPTVYQAGDGTHFATLPRIDDLYAWLRNCATEIERFRQQDQNYILPISLRTLLGETGWKQALDSSTTRFYINPDLFPDQAHVRLRGVRAFTYGTQQADGYWGARLILPTRVRSRDMTGVTTVRDQDSLPAMPMPTGRRFRASIWAPTPVST